METLSKTAQPDAAPSAQHIHRQQMHITRQFVWLLVILCAASLASLPLTKTLLPQTTSPQTQKTVAPRYNDGTCTAKPENIRYKQPGKKITTTPSQWSKAGKSLTAFELAQACAAAFTLSYETFDSAQLATLSSATSMLSIAVQERFLRGNPQYPASYRFQTAWQTQARLHHLQQSAIVISPATLRSVESIHARFSASFIVAYNLTTQASGKTTQQHKQLQVVLSIIPYSPIMDSTGWQVTDWNEITKP